MAAKTDQNSYMRDGLVFVIIVVLSALIGWAIKPEYWVPGLVIGLALGFIALPLLTKK